MTTSIPVTHEPARPSFWRRLLGYARAAAKGMTIFYVALLLVLLPALEWWGERNWLLSLLIYAPPQLLLAPMLVLSPFCAVFRARCLLVHAGCAVVVFSVYMTHRSTNAPAAEPGTLKVITHNVGQGNPEQFQAFMREQQSDVILLQDLGFEAAKYRFSGMHVVTRGEFLIASRHPVRRADVLHKPLWRGRAVAARFEILWQGQPVALYDVHLPTPRAQFNRFLSKRVVTDLMGDEDRAGGFAGYREWIEERRKLAQDLADVFAAEQMPFIACGDFNTPDHGFIYHLFAARMIDAHAAAGNGYGMTFPCDVKQLVDTFGPWLRIDYAFAGKGWRPVYCETNAGKRSQHRAVAARFSRIERR